MPRPALLLRLAVVLLALSGVVGAAAADRGDAVYRALADGRLQEAEELSTAWLADAPPDGVGDVAALRAQLDVLRSRHRLGSEAGLALARRLEREQHGHAGTAPLRELYGWARGLEDGTVSPSLESRAATSPEAAWLAAEAAFAANRNAAAIDWAQRALRGDGEGLRARWRGVLVRGVLARALYGASRPQDAVAVDREAARIAHADFGAASELAVRTDVHLAGVLHTLGRYREGRDLCESLVAAVRARRDASDTLRVLAEQALATALDDLGDDVGARRQVDITAALLDSGAPRDPIERGRVAITLGLVLHDLGDDAAALVHLRRALPVFRDQPAQARVTSIVLTGIGDAEFQLGHTRAAHEAYAGAHAARLAADGEHSFGLAPSLFGLGATALAAGEYEEARQRFTAVLAQGARAFAPQHPRMTWARFGLALAHLGLGDPESALQEARRAAQAQQALLAQIATQFVERDSVRYRALLVPATPLVVSLSALRGDRAALATAWRLTMTERGLIARSEAARLALARAHGDPALSPLWQGWQAATTALADAWLRGAATPALERLQREAAAAEAAFWARTGRRAAMAAPTTPGLDALAAALPAEGRLFAVAEGLDLQPARPLQARASLLPEDWYAFGLDARGSITLQRLGAIDALSADTRAWYAAVRDPRTPEAEVRRRGTALRRDLFDRSEALAAGTLFFVPEGELFRLNPATLPLAQGYAVEAGLGVHTLAHEADLLRPGSPHWQGRALLAGAPAFGAAARPRPTPGSAARCAESAGDFAELPQATAELDRLHRVLASEATRNDRIELLHGAGASVRRVAAALPGASLVHLATHGFAAGADCPVPGATRSLTLDAPTDRRDDTAEGAWSGLAFGSDGGGIGVLSAAELLTLDLSQARWVTLSSCDSGLGPVARGEGVFGLRRALHLAGAATVVMSLWEVDDAATADLMEALYRARFLARRSVPDALAEAMRVTLRARRAAGLADTPYYWGAFVGEGAWR